MNGKKMTFAREMKVMQPFLIMVSTTVLTFPVEEKGLYMPASNLANYSCKKVKGIDVHFRSPLNCFLSGRVDQYHSHACVFSFT